MRRTGRVGPAAERWVDAVLSTDMASGVKLAAVAYAHCLVRGQVVSVEAVAVVASMPVAAVNAAMDALMVAGYMSRSDMVAELMGGACEEREDRITLSLPSGELL